MSLSLDKLRLLRRQAGDAKAVTPSAPAGPLPQPAPGLPAAANDAKQPDAARSVFAWVEKEIRHKPTGVAAPPRQVADAMGLRRLLGVRGRGNETASTPRARAQDRSLPGTEIAPGLHLIESFLPGDVPSAPLSLAFAKREQQHVAPQDLLFFDTETTGLAGGTGTRAFMIGAADWHQDPSRGPGLRIRQLMISTMAAETAMLRTFTSWLGSSTVFSSYNGRSYDAPLLKTRYRLARQGDPITALDHIDLLYPTRRRYRGVWENCRLATIERQLLKVVREDDLPGSEAPSAWLRYLRGGDAVNLRRVVEHNHQDVVTLAQLFLTLVEQQAQADVPPPVNCLPLQAG
ncbi:ribonuclease H-like domain-containing protein [Stenotrophomonas sp. CFBP8980]|uniref:ribonuclease H-like domain-containing protein n=1 Tax=Stenotrophomonas sp. CFBP8980 TaxID=3096523 RepID=UPI002A6A5E30|nr:ribonuclease H-like domain-containing protein [Stenotrophomonas sp. CFBP8980]MDY1034769.1 ribonuclease H-like domain-containing protein [Stenotrophomonas sp. CFBP8980]